MNICYFIMRKKINEHYFYERLHYRLERYNVYEMPIGSSSPEIDFSFAIFPDTPRVGIHFFLPFGIRVLCPDLLAGSYPQIYWLCPHQGTMVVLS